MGIEPICPASLIQTPEDTLYAFSSVAQELGVQLPDLDSLLNDNQPLQEEEYEAVASVLDSVLTDEIIWTMRQKI